MCEVRIRTVQLCNNLDEIPNSHTLRCDNPNFAVPCNFIWPSPYLANIGDVPLKSYEKGR